MENPRASWDGITCPSCGDENEARNRFCTHCGKLFPEEKKKLWKRRYILSGATTLVLAISTGFFGTGVLEPKLIGKVNGEGITWKEFSKRVDRVQKGYERLYGEDLFQGDTGNERLNRLKTQVLNTMVLEKLLLQEARSAGYTSASKEEVEKEIEVIKKKNGLTDSELEKKEGATIDDLREEIGRQQVIAQFVEKAVLKGVQERRDIAFRQWLAQAKAKAEIETYEKWESASTARASCCQNGCGGGEGRAQSLDPKTEQDAKAKGLEYYESKRGKKGEDAKVTNFGCHIQVDILEAGKVVLSLTYSEGEVEEL